MKYSLYLIKRMRNEIFVVYRREFMNCLNLVDPASGCGSLVCV